ncbi:MAG: cytochrome b [Acidiferrobacterales bacterium]|nr:cytochrome b [Acidiferrobacterales bacterium]
MKDTLEKFSFPTIAFHWVIAIGMIAMLAFGLYLDDMPRSPEKGELIGLHKSFGIIILSLAILRILWRIKNKFPIPVAPMDEQQARVAKITHWVLIVATALMPISGVLMSVGGGHPVGVFGFELIAAGEKNALLSNVGHRIHGAGANVVMIFIVLHIAGAIKHHFFDKDATLTRMLGRSVASRNK